MATHEQRKSSVELAMKFFTEHVLPRRIEDRRAELLNNSCKRIYRKIEFDEEDRGQAFPVWNAFFETFAHFGLGVGIYFMQLMFLSAVYLIAGLIMVVAIQSYKENGNDLGKEQNFLVSISAACSTMQNITATLGCGGDYGECDAQYRSQCVMPYRAGVADLIMCVFLLLAILVSKLAEERAIEKLDESVQTAQDYSVEVADPDEDADDPDKWYSFFSRFGPVRYITIKRKNFYLLEAIVEIRKKEQKLERERLEIASGARQSSEKSSDCCKRRSLARLESEVEFSKKQVSDLCKTQLSLPVCRVYVTFEHEDSQRLCISEMEVPDIEAIMDSNAGSTKERYKYMGTKGPNVLDVSEPPEPDNVIWRNLEVGRTSRRVRTCFVSIFSVGILVCSYYLLLESRKASMQMFAITIALIDVLLPIVFKSLSDFTMPCSEGSAQNIMQLKLFLTRLMLATIFPYMQVSWKDTLSADFMSQVIQVQLAVSFLGSAMSLLDPVGHFRRHIWGPWAHADSQNELNSQWIGTDWSIAERYTNIAKIQFVSLYYALLIPMTMFISSIAFLLIFLIDRFLLLRRWKPFPMVGPQLASRLRQQFLLGLCLHMWVSLRFIYSWPMDEVFIHNDGTIEKVDKYPSTWVFTMEVQHWMGNGQKNILRPFLIVFCLVFILTCYVWIIDPFFRAFRKMFCVIRVSVGKSQGIPFSSLTRCPVYVPVFSIGVEEQDFLCSYFKDVLPQHKPALLNFHGANEGQNLDLSHYIPLVKQPYVLSIVKYYGDSDDLEQPLSGSGVDDATSKGKVLVTNTEGKLTWETQGLPDDLMSKIRGRTVSPTAATSNKMSGTGTRSSGIALGGGESKYDVDRYDDLYGDVDDTNTGSGHVGDNPYRQQSAARPSSSRHFGSLSGTTNDFPDSSTADFSARGGGGMTSPFGRARSNSNNNGRSHEMVRVSSSRSASFRQPLAPISLAATAGAASSHMRHSNSNRNNSNKYDKLNRTYG